MASHIDNQIEEARNRLLDLTLRNRLINFKPSTRRTIRITSEDPAEIYGRLVLEERSLGFRPKPQDTPADEMPHAGTDGIEEDGRWDSTSDTAGSSGRRSLWTDVSEEVLPRQLFRMSNEASSVLEEQGYTVLYLALGFLKWQESPSSETVRLAPLVLVPVELTRTKVREAYRVKWTGEDVGTNLSLQARLADAGVAIPDFEMPEDPSGLREYFSSVSESVAEKTGWTVKEDAYLGFFSFTKFVMYKDLDPAGWPEGEGPSSHPLIRALFSPGETTQSGDLFPEEEVDERLSWSSVYHVLDADPSQIAAIEDAKAGLNLVVQGPPGTGKSQTITNMVGELLAHGKTVLFVSEKMAALEVVKRRLDEVGLGEFCLELHSRKSRKRDVLAELEKCLNRHGTQSQPDDAGRRSALVEHIKKLNNYARDLRTPFGSLQLSPYQLYDKREAAILHFSEAGREVPRLTLDESEWSHDQLARASQELHALADLLVEVGPPSDHPWTGCRPGPMLPYEVDELMSRVKEAIDAVRQLGEAGRELSAQLGSLPLSSLQDVKSQRECLDLLQRSPWLPATTLLLDDWANETRIKAALDLVDNIQQRRAHLSTLFTDEALTTDAESILARMRDASSGPMPVLARSYREWKRSIASLYQQRPSLFHRHYEEELTGLAEYQQELAELAEYDSICSRLFGHLWEAPDSDVAELRKALDWVGEFRRFLAEGICTEELGHKAEERPSGQAELYLKVQKLEDLADDVEARASSLLTELRIDPQVVLGSSCSSARLGSLLDRLEQWHQHSHKLPLWIRYQTLKGSDKLSSVRELVEALEDGRIEKSDIEACLNLQVSETELRRVFAERQSLREFEGTLHESAVDRFRQLDNEVMTASRREVCQALRARRPQLFGGVARDSEAGILLREVNKKKRHMPIRKLMEQTGGLVQKVKPCFMMSPLSIAQFLDPRSARFDVIIFDEASQVRPQDAIGALLRGKQLVVMGDTRQLPPTSFFDRLVEDADDEDEHYADHLGDIESILHLCRRSFPSRTLKWHYRSRHESLIAVSNQEFYDNCLIVYPSPVQDTEDLGLQFVHLPDTVYDRGRTSENRQEAVAVARAAVQHYKTRPDLSLGVGAFSTKQQNAILEEVQRELEEHPEVEGHFSPSRHEHFFVKNLETIQGDERDVILLSVGYGFDRLGKLSRNFGPLNHEGGERRLNVLITRARSRCEVYSNFRAEDLRTDAQAPRGLAAMKAFMHFAETGKLAESRTEARDSDSPFEDAVCAFLRNEGFQVEQQVGCAGYRIDMAVADPSAPGRFVLGIECDGAQYHSSRVARERDRLRQLVLERLGWQIYRIWSTDWYTQRKVAQERVLRAVQEAMSAYSGPASERSGDDTHLPQARVEVPWSPPSGAREEPPGKRDASDGNLAGELPTECYVVCESIGISMHNDIHATPRTDLAHAVSKVVEVEGPIHVDEVIRRIRTLWGLKRSGRLIREAVRRGVRLACSSSEYPVRQQGDFLWREEQRECSPRCRQERELLKIELISDEEIGSAVVRTLELQYASPREAIAPTAARLLGFQQTSEQIRSRIGLAVMELLKQGRIAEKESGILDLKGDEPGS